MTTSDVALCTGCDWVLSTARHEFVGMAVTEALVAGCLPWLPSRLAYPELVPDDGLDLTPWSGLGDQAAVDLGRRIRTGLERARAEVAVAEIESTISEVIRRFRAEEPR